MKLKGGYPGGPGEGGIRSIKIVRFEDYLFYMEQEKKNYTETTSQNVIFKKLSHDKFFVDSPCFLTVPYRVVQLNGIYLKAEGQHFDAIRILKIHFKAGFIYLTVQDLKSERIYNISHIIGDNYPCIWWLISIEYIENEVINKIKTKDLINDNSLLEFDY